MRSIRPFALYVACAACAILCQLDAARAADNSWTIQIVARSAEPLSVHALAQADGDLPVITPLRVRGDAQPSANAAPDGNNAAAPPVTSADEAAPRSFDPTLYASIRRSIPFSRAEYMANPGYRHDATMSLLLGQPYYTPASGNYVPRTLDSFPIPRRFGRVVFGYEPMYWRPFWGWGAGYPLGYAN